MIVTVLPAYNENEYLKNCVDSVLEELTKLKADFTIVIAEDGSTDGTAEIAAKLSSENPRILHFHSDRKLGRGNAVRHACDQISTRINGVDAYVYLDVDLATDMKQFSELVNWVLDGYDLVQGSRYLKNSVVERPLLRKVTSEAYNRAMQFLFHTGCTDHQCGFRVFSSRLVTNIFNKCEFDGWFWDTEIIVLAKKHGYKIKEIPVRWKEKRRKATDKKRLIKDILHHAYSALKLWLRLEFRGYS